MVPLDRCGALIEAGTCGHCGYGCHLSLSLCLAVLPWLSHWYVTNIVASAGLWYFVFLLCCHSLPMCWWQIYASIKLFSRSKHTHRKTVKNSAAVKSQWTYADISCSRWNKTSTWKSKPKNRRRWRLSLQNLWKSLLVLQLLLNRASHQSINKCTFNLKNKCMPLFFIIKSTPITKTCR